MIFSSSRRGASRFVCFYADASDNDKLLPIFEDRMAPLGNGNHVR